MDGPFKRFQKPDVLTAFGSIGIPSLIIAGYLLLTGCGLWGFTKLAEASAVPRPADPEAASLICRCVPGSSLGSGAAVVPQQLPFVEKL